MTTQIQLSSENTHIPTNELLAEYFSKRTEQVPFEETKDEFVFHVPKAFVMRWFDEYSQASRTSNNSDDKVEETTEDFGSLYTFLQDMPKASYEGDPVAIQQKMRDEWL